MRELPIPMFSPEPGDVILRGSVDRGFELVDAVTGQPRSGRLPDVEFAITVARDLNIATIWQQVVDHDGRPTGEPTLLWQMGA